jgi:hypothetical protein
MVRWLHFVLHVPSQESTFQVTGRKGIMIESELEVGLFTVQLFNWPLEMSSYEPSSWMETSLQSI